MRNRDTWVAIVLLFVAMMACGPTTERPPLVISPSELPDARVGQSYEVTITVSGDQTPVYTIAVDSAELPPGLALHYEEGANTATIEGVPEEAGTFEFTVKATCLGTMVNGQTGEQLVTLLVEPE